MIMDLGTMIGMIQRAVGAKDDQKFGPVTAGAVLAALKRGEVEDVEGVKVEGPRSEELDGRTMKNIGTLDVRARDAFARFARQAKAVAGSMGCDYVMISGNRTWGEQDALYAQGRTVPGQVVTNARGGFSNHNFGIAGDFGVFRGGTYLDETDAKTAAAVHRACAAHAEGCGLDWGGRWDGFPDLPHYEISTTLSMEQKRRRYEQTGTVL